MAQTHKKQNNKKHIAHQDATDIQKQTIFILFYL